MKRLLAVVCSASCLAAGAGPVLEAPGLRIELTPTGELSGSCRGGSSLVGCRMEGPVAVEKVADGCSVTREVTDGHGHRCVLTDIFRPTANSIRWEVQMVSTDAFWTTPVEMRIQVPAAEASRLWTAWIGGEAWTDPLVSQPLADRTWDYGNGPDTICIPVASVLEPASDAALGLAVSPEQPLLWLQLSTTRDGTMIFRHKLLRLGGGRKVTFAADLIAHESGWRGGLRWMTQRYPGYFDPPNPRADAMAGTASYSRRMTALASEEAERLKKMAYRTDWEASFNWPYFGMFLPAMPSADAEWRTYGYNSAGGHDPALVRPISYRRLNEKGRARRESGFFTLAYFNVTEFGVGINEQAQVNTSLPDAECWRDANAFLRRRIADGMLRDENGRTSGTWGGAIGMDSGGPAFRQALLEQARQMALLPDFDGICIDRMDWLPRVNFAAGADDGVGWYLGGRPGRHLGWSWNGTLAKLGPILHGMDKVIFVNCCNRGHRLDFVRDVDGFYDEYGDNGYSLNGSGLLALRKPALMWTHEAGSIKPDSDSYFQRHLHLGAYPTAPFPGNDHTILPGPRADRWYLDYGPLLDAMRGKKWVLVPHCVDSDTPGAKVNLFEVPGGYALPVTFAGPATSAVVHVRGLPGLVSLRADALHPAAAQPTAVPAAMTRGALELQVPLVRGCAMVRLTR